MIKRTGCTVLIFLGLLGTIFSQEHTSARNSWHDNKYSMFIHFGVYSELGGFWQGKAITRGYSEQIQAHAGILTDIYDELPASFNPVNWNADSIASLAKQAGMRSIVITSKHHDGFCMYHSAYTRFNVVDATPFKRDVIRELSIACQKAGLHFGLYYSLIDYRLHPIASHNANPITADHHQYNKNQITELLTNYGPISEMWFDMGSLTVLQSREIYDLVHKLQPDCMVSGRLGNDAYDFCVMGDNAYPDYKIDTPWQTPASMFNETWGYRSWQKREDPSGKTQEKLLSLIKVVSRGGNFLLNIGPMGDGSVVPYEAEVLKGIGKWLAKNGEAIYHTRANPLPDTYPWGEITTKGNSLYLILSGKQIGQINISGVSGKIKMASLLGDAKIVLRTGFNKGILEVIIPYAAYSGSDFRVIKLEFLDPIQVKPEQPISGNNICLDFQHALKYYSYSCIDYYTNYRSVVKLEWNFLCKKGEINPFLNYTKGELGAEIELIWNGKSNHFTLKEEEKIPLNKIPGTINWGNRFSYGPFESDLESNPGSVAPELNTDLDWNRGEQLKWKQLMNWENGKEDSVTTKPFESRYILQEISSDKSQKQLVEICSGDGVQIWLNGENLVTHNNLRGSSRNKELVLLPLKAGKNQLLVKFHNRFGYEMIYNIDSHVDQTLFQQKLPQQNVKGIGRCEMKLLHPASPHQPLRLNNVSIHF